MTRAARPGGAALPKTRRANAVTVDVEEWFHICGQVEGVAFDRWPALPSRVLLTTRLLLDDLDRAGIRATFFVLGWVAERHPELVAEILSAGHEVGSHGHLHTRVYEMEPETFRAELRQSVAALTSAGAPAVRSFRAPEWSINGRSLWALDVLAGEGFTIDASMAPVRLVGDVTYPRHPHVRATPYGPILEVPPLVVDRLGQPVSVALAGRVVRRRGQIGVVDRMGQVMPIGWGWGLRMSSPWRVLRSIEEGNVAGLPSVLTVHPWEIDPEPPRVPLPLRLRFAHYFRLDGFRARLSAMLRGADFGALGDLDVVRASRPS